jgi:hypothetical protein
MSTESRIIGNNPVIRRKKALDRLNVAQAAIATAGERFTEAYQAHEKLVNAAKSEFGTALSLLRRAERDYESARRELFSLTPEMPAMMTETRLTPLETIIAPIPNFDLDVEAEDLIASLRVEQALGESGQGLAEYALRLAYLAGQAAKPASSLNVDPDDAPGPGSSADEAPSELPVAIPGGASSRYLVDRRPARQSKSAL